MQALETITGPALLKEINKKCPFQEQAQGNPDHEPEHIPNDDRKEASAIQANNGGTLGTNLINGESGKKSTILDEKKDPYKAPCFEHPRQDTAREKAEGRDVRVLVAGDSKKTPFTMAAHHLIPGEASLAPSELYKFMKKDSDIDVIFKGGGKKKFKIGWNIGYNVNGSHNGAWLPGNYAIGNWGVLGGTSAKNYADATDPDWVYNYMVAVVKKTLTSNSGGQFHDAHTDYSAEVKKNLNKIATALVEHMSVCTDCANQTKKIAPPYRIKRRLFQFSQDLEKYLVKSPGTANSKLQWKRPWMTSDRWGRAIFGDPKKFLKAYAKAQP